MSEINTYDEILEFAIAREQQASHFFLALAERVESAEIRKVFEDLAEEELEHKARLELEVMKKGKTIAQNNKKYDFNPSDYIIADELTLDMDYKDILMLGIVKEDASFRLYVDLAAHVTNEESRDTLLSLAEEEVKHKLRFETEYDNLLKQS